MSDHVKGTAQELDLTNLKVNQPSLGDAADLMQAIEDAKVRRAEKSCIGQRVHVPSELISKAANYWKEIYFGITADGRLLSGIEAYDLGDDKHQLHPDKSPYIAMCNLMVLEALVIMGDSWPTTEDPVMMGQGSDREKAVADFWKKSFAPTLFQVNWAWKAALAIMAGEPFSTREILHDFKDQLP